MTGKNRGTVESCRKINIETTKRGRSSAVEWTRIGRASGPQVTERYTAAAGKLPKCSSR